jgi:hypothetical protein
MNRYSNSTIKHLPTSNLRSQGTSYLTRTKYPRIFPSENDIYVITEWGDRFDQLAFQFYGDVSLWWIITTANPNKTPGLSMFCEVGVQLVIPQNLTKIMSDFSSLNASSQTALQSSGNGGGNGGSSVGSSGGY